MSVKSRTEKTINTVLSSMDLEKFFEVSSGLSREKIEEVYKKDGVKEVFEVDGFKAPPGFHLHYVDENNNYFPPEGDALNQLAKSGTEWARIEIRGAVKEGGCQAACGICTGDSLD